MDSVSMKKGWKFMWDLQEGDIVAEHQDDPNLETVVLHISRNDAVDKDRLGLAITHALNQQQGDL